MTEAQFQSAVITLACLCGWMVHHTRAAQIRPGVWATPIQGTAGWPDLVLARHGEFMVVELKKDGGRLTAGQKAWLLMLDSAGIETHVWYPKDMEQITDRLQRKADTCKQMNH
jgi:hypothetical protein